MRILIVLAMLVGIVENALAEDLTINRSVSLRVGETKPLMTVGAHKSDCKTSISGDVQITQAPRLGALSQRYNMPYVVGVSMSGTCLGMRVYGTEIDYTASSSGKDLVRFDAIFRNGTTHYNIAIAIH
jgi:hypothetical protein